jgi:hypothetical protein
VGDVSGDGRVDIRDVVIAVRDLFRQDLRSDVNRDGKVTLRDLVLVLKALRRPVCP